MRGGVRGGGEWRGVSTVPWRMGQGEVLEDWCSQGVGVEVPAKWGTSGDVREGLCWWVWVSCVKRGTGDQAGPPPLLAP